MSFLIYFFYLPQTKKTNKSIHGSKPSVHSAHKTPNKTFLSKQARGAVGQRGERKKKKRKKKEEHVRVGNVSVSRGIKVMGLCEGCCRIPLCPRRARGGLGSLLTCCAGARRGGEARRRGAGLTAGGWRLTAHGWRPAGGLRRAGALLEGWVRGRRPGRGHADTTRCSHKTVRCGESV